jgi:hypothetical protein
MRRILFALIALVLASFTTKADDVKFTMSAPSIVSIGEQFSLTLSLNAKGEDLRMPSLDNFELLMGPSISQSRSFTSINGKMTQSVEFSYTYILRASKEGTFTIPSASVKSDRKVYQSNEVTVQVIQGRQNQSQASGSTGSGQAQAQGNEQPATAGSKDNLFIRYEVDKRNLYKGESFVATLKLYSRVALSLVDQTLPSLEGFWAQDIDIPPADQTRTREAVDGIIYNVYTLSKKVLVPQQTGNLSIGKAEMVFNVQQRTAPQSIFDDFFGSYQNVKVKISSDRVPITVRELPGNPTGFTGAVGRFTLNSNIDKTKVKSNEAITLKVTVSGNGNLKHITPLNFDFPADFEVYDPKTDYNHKVSEAGISGTTTFEYLMIPRFAGKFSIPAQQFVYFDTNSKSFQTLSTNAFEIEVEKGANDESALVRSSASKQDVKFVGNDIRFIKQGQYKLRPTFATFFGSSFFYLSYIAAILAFGAFVFLQRKKLRENANIAFMRNKKASTMARKHLKQAAICVKQNNKDAFFDALLKAFWGYLSDKLTIPLADLNRDSAKATLQAHEADEQSIAEFMELIDTCEMAKFAPTAVTNDIATLYNQSVKLIEQFERQIKKKA